MNALQHSCLLVREAVFEFPLPGSTPPAIGEPACDAESGV